MKFSLTILLVVISTIATIVYSAHVGQYSKNRKSHPAEGFSKASNEFGFHLLNELSKHTSTSTSTSSISTTTTTTTDDKRDGSSSTSSSSSSTSTTSKKTKSKNVLFSPYGVAVALSMLHQGAEGTTAEQFKHVLNYDRVKQFNDGGDYKKTVATSLKQTQDKINHYQQQEQQQQKQSQSEQSYENRFDYGNVLLVDQQVPVKDDYRKTIEQYYDGEIFNVDFHKDTKSIKDRVNQYVSNRTHGYIDRMLDEQLSSTTLLTLINAVYFKGEWLKKFDELRTEQGVFYDEYGHEYNNVQYLNGEGPYGYVDVPQWNADLVQIPYKGDELAFYAVLPRERTNNLDTIRNTINSTYVDELVGQIVDQQTNVYLPKFQLQTKYQLPEVLKQLGLRDVFTEQSNLSGLTDTTTKTSLKINDVLHKAKFILNEHGTEVGAGTYVELTLLSTMETTKTFRFDHPFLYFIRHLPTGQILFLGELHDFQQY